MRAEIKNKQYDISVPDHSSCAKNNLFFLDKKIDVNRREIETMVLIL